MTCLQWLESRASALHFTATAGTSADIHAILAGHLPAGSSLLEMGSGHGPDIAALTKRYQVTASDLCNGMVSHLRASHPALSVLGLDAVTIDSPGAFDAIFSNKVMQHLSDEQLHQSMRRQQLVVRRGGIIAHTFWANSGGRSVSKTDRCPLGIVAKYFEIAEVVQYGAFLADDSLLVIARNSHIVA